MLSSSLHKLKFTTKAQLSLAAGSVQCQATCVNFCKCQSIRVCRDKICPCTNPAHEPESVNIVIVTIVIVITIVIVVIVISNKSIVFIGNTFILEIPLLLS